VVTGGASQVAEHRTGRMIAGEFFESLGGSLVHSPATHPNITELVAFADDVRTFRISTNTLGAPILPEENTSAGRDVTKFDLVADPEDDGIDVQAFANFMRATKVPTRGPIAPDVRLGEAVFTKIGCATCHVSSFTTAAPGTVINGGALIVPVALGNKVIHPYSDFLLHDIGSGDGIPVLPTQEYATTSNKIRTAPLWALRTRNRLMHDGLTFTREDAILRDAGQALECGASIKP
jgi:CxxC motif-containing protein (DUF1111 family)